MDEFTHPRVIVGVDSSLSGLAALRTAVAEARCRQVPLHAIRARAAGLPCAERETITLVFLEALGAMPTDIEIHRDLSFLGIPGALRADATDPRDLIVVGNSGKGWWHAFWFGSVSRCLIRHAHCPILAVPAPELARTARRARRWNRLTRRDLWERFEQEVPELRHPPRVDG